MEFLRFVSNAALVGKFFLRKPRFLARTMRSFLRATLRKGHQMRFMDIAVDYACNLTCSHCSALPMQRTDQSPLSVEEYRRIAADLRRAGVVLFHFTGGEPLLRKDLEEIIDAFDPGSSCISIQTNGFPATPARLQSLRRAGVDILCVSLDSGIESEHDSFRGRRGSYRKVLEVQEQARALGFVTMVSTCVSHENLHSDGLREVIELTRRMGVSCQFNLAVPTGHWRDNAAVVLTEEDKAEVRRLLKEHRHCRLDLYHNWSKVGCGAIKEKLYLNPYGDVLPCPFIPVSFGNLKSERVADVRASAFKVRHFREYWPECLAAEDREFMEQLNRFHAEGGLPLRRFDAERWTDAATEPR